MHLKFSWFLQALIASALLACTPSQQKGQDNQTSQGEITDTIDFNFPVQFHYAQGLKIINNKGYKTIYIFHPDRPDTIATYVLYPREKECPVLASENISYIPVPAHNIACLSTTQIGALPLLGEEDKLIGCISIQNICNPKIRKRVQEGTVKEIGRGMSKNIELIAGLRPEILLQDLFHMTEKDADLNASGIHTVLYNEWKERDLLGRAEWMKLTAMLLGRNKKADEVFAQIEAEYLKAKKLASNVTDTIPIMYGQEYKGVWYLPGEYSYVTAMFKDARVKFDYAAGKVSSQPYSFEYIFSQHRHAPIWICMMTGNVKTREDFLALNERYRHFDAAQNGKIFIDRKQVNESGGNCFWETGLYRPDLLLKDIIKITHPDLLPDYETSYWIELKK